MSIPWKSITEPIFQNSLTTASTDTAGCCDTNMAAVSLFWDTNKAAYTSCENTV